MNYDATDTNPIIFPPVRKCIYCGRDPTREDPLSNEHIIPYSMGGNIILPLSSCRDCANATKKFEQICARRMFGNFRVAMNVKTRNRKVRPKTLEMKFKAAGDEDAKTYIVPIEHYPIIAFAIPHMYPPNILRGKCSSESFEIQIRILNGSKEFGFLPPDSGDQQFQNTLQVEITPFARLLCKIAHSFAVAVHGLDAYEWLLPDLIIGDHFNHPDFVGCVTKPNRKTPTFIGPLGEKVLLHNVHALSCEKVFALSGSYQSVVIQLWNELVPLYRVIVARA